MPFDLLLERLEPLDVARHHPRGSKLGGAALDATNGFEQLEQLLAPEGRDNGAAVEAELDQAFARKLLERLAQRGTRDASASDISDSSSGSPGARSPRTMSMRSRVAACSCRPVRGTRNCRRCNAVTPRRRLGSFAVLVCLVFVLVTMASAL
jgi:hypothetical protein